MRENKAAVLTYTVRASSGISLWDLVDFRAPRRWVQNEGLWPTQFSHRTRATKRVSLALTSVTDFVVVV